MTTYKPYQRTQVRCVETGIVFKGVAEAAEMTGCSKSAMVNHLNRPGHFIHVRGLHFERVAKPNAPLIAAAPELLEVINETHNN